MGVIRSRELCPHCGGTADPSTTCPRSVECPLCGAPAGSPCRRPSGRRATSPHAGRVELAEARDAGSGILEAADELELLAELELERHGPTVAETMAGMDGAYYRPGAAFGESGWFD